jgi:hypothetical protein
MAHCFLFVVFEVLSKGWTGGEDEATTAFIDLSDYAVGVVHEI